MRVVCDPRTKQNIILTSARAHKGPTVSTALMSAKYCKQFFYSAEAPIPDVKSRLNLKTLSLIKGISFSTMSETTYMYNLGCVIF